MATARQQAELSAVETSTVPEGFRKIRIGGNFVDATGGLHGRWSGNRIQLGFRVEQQHVNPHGICHGGMLATLADMLVPCAAVYQEKVLGRFLPTVSLQIDFLDAARLGAWVDAQAEILRKTRNLLFAQGLIRADGEIVARLSGVYKIGPAVEHALAHDPFGLLTAEASS